jgi:hypothetical protein
MRRVGTAHRDDELVSGAHAMSLVQGLESEILAALRMTW